MLSIKQWKQNNKKTQQDKKGQRVGMVYYNNNDLQ